MKRLAHLDGLRVLAQLWILAAENLYIGWKPNWMRRPDAAVSLFIALSGFCTHWAYADKRSPSTFKAMDATLPFWVGRFMKTAFLYYLALVICIVLKSPNMEPPLFVGGYDKYPLSMTNGEYVSALMPSLAVLHPWVPYQESDKDYVLRALKAVWSTVCS